VRWSRSRRPSRPRVEPDLILLDAHLPDIPGIKVLERLRADPTTRPTPIVIVTADVTSEARRRFIDSGADDYLTKPLDLDKIVDLVDGLLARKADAET
jgi:DNA-binding response OmpR family regulator